MPNPLTFVISDDHEIALADESIAEPLLLDSPLVINGRIRQPKQADRFWIDVRVGNNTHLKVWRDAVRQLSLDPASPIYDSSGGL